MYVHKVIYVVLNICDTIYIYIHIIYSFIYITLLSKLLFVSYYVYKLNRNKLNDFKFNFENIKYVFEIINYRYLIIIR